jgi:hypothetical protein
MSVSDIHVPDILETDFDYARLWALFKGSLSNLPTHLDGDNIVSLFMTFDYQLENLRRIKDYMITSRQVDDIYSFSMNGNEVNDRMALNGTPFMATDKSISKKRRLKNWLEYELGGGTEETVKAAFYTYIGTETFIDFEDVNILPKDTTRIIVASPNASAKNWSTEGGVPAVSNPLVWLASGTFVDSDEAEAAGGGVWTDENTLSDADIDMQIFFGYSGVYTDERDITYWQSGVNVTKLSRLMDKVMPVGTVYTISLFYDGV